MTLNAWSEGRRTPAEVTSAYDEGVQAARDGVPFVCCPYTTREVPRMGAWRNGHTAEKERLRRDEDARVSKILGSGGVKYERAQTPDELERKRRKSRERREAAKRLLDNPA